MYIRFSLTALLLFLLPTQALWCADAVPTEVQQPGTQPEEVDPLESPSTCASCHDPSGNSGPIAPTPSWRGSTMAHAARDPLFWATMAVSESDFDGSGDLCLRCHTTSGWIGGRSTPTDGSSLLAQDADGVDCEYCHKLTDPNKSEHSGVQVEPFLANDKGDPAPDTDPNNVLSYYGGTMGALFAESHRLGPYVVNAPHKTKQSTFHRSVDFCGTCHDVSNPVVGNLAHNNGAQSGADPVYTDTEDASGTGPGVAEGDVDGKAAFNNFPYKYGIIERTFSEYKAGLLWQTPVWQYSLALPADLQAGAIEAARNAALLAGQDGNYEDGTTRYFSCQTCHMPPAVGKGAGQSSAPERSDLPVHNLSGGNYWIGSVIQYLDSFNPSRLRLGGDLTGTQVTALNAAADLARQQLNLAASLSVNSNILTVTNLTGHKLITGYPEGRRMWLNILWYDAGDALLREDGAYGPLVDDHGAPVMVNDPATDTPVQVHSLLDLNDTNTKVYKAHYGMTKEWADRLAGLGYSDALVLAYDRYTGVPLMNLGQLRALAAGSAVDSFHFVLNNVVRADNRIPPYGMHPEEARKRNVLPVPATQYGGGLGGSYNYWDEVQLNPPVGADRAEINLKYQPTSWEHIQFLYLANDESSDFLGKEGVNILEAWLHTGMAEPHVMASTTWTNGSVADCNGDGTNADLDGFVFEGISVCEASVSIVAPNVTVKSTADVTFRAPAVSFGVNSKVEAESIFRIQSTAQD